MAEERADQIVDNALLLAESRSWEQVRLHQVADMMGIELTEVSRYFKDKEAVAEAWFDRADRAMLRETASFGFRDLPARDRLERLINAWLEALAPHKRVTRQIIFGKLEPGHLQVQIPAILRISRTVQWMREAARMDATYLRRAFEETTLTTIFVTTFMAWLNDRSVHSDTTRLLLHNLLWGAERASWWLTLGQAWSTSDLPVKPPPPPPVPCGPEG